MFQVFWGLFFIMSQEQVHDIYVGAEIQEADRA